MSKNVLYNSRYFHYWEKLKFDYNEYFGSMVSTKPIKKHIRRTKTLEWYIKINRDNFTVNPLGVKTYFHHLIKTNSDENKIRLAVRQR